MALPKMKYAAFRQRLRFRKVMFGPGALVAESWPFWRTAFTTFCAWGSHLTEAPWRIIRSPGLLRTAAFDTPTLLRWILTDVFAALSPKFSCRCSVAVDPHVLHSQVTESAHFGGGGGGRGGGMVQVDGGGSGNWGSRSPAHGLQESWGQLQ